MAAEAKGQTLVASRTPHQKKKKRKTEQQQQIDPILNIFPLLHTDTNDGIQTNPNMRPEVIKKYVHREK